MDKSIQGYCIGFSRAVALLLISGGGWISPFQAFAQTTLPGSPAVTMTSPASGATVARTVPVSASVAEPGALAGVQFKLDGVNLGAEDTAAPYSVSWDTTTAGEGWHTLTAVARYAGGLRFSSDPVTVTVSNGPAPSAAARRHEESDASIKYSPGWSQSDPNWFAWSGGAAVESVTPGAWATFTFTGTSVTWIGYRSGRSGIARVSVDGVFVSEVDLFARSDEIHVPVFTMRGLADGSHTITIEVTGLKNKDSLVTDPPAALVVVDAFDVPAPVVSHLQNTDSIMTYTGDWNREDGSKAWSAGSAAVSGTANAQATLTFKGTAVSWSGYRGPDAGTARVYLDGSLAGEVDTYSPTHRVQDTVFTATGLSDASHTLTIEATGFANAASTGTQVVVDAFDVTTPGTRYEETDWTVTYAGDWVHGNRDRAYSEGTAAESITPAQATFTFTGTSVSWIGACGPQTGIARVYLDRVFVAEIDTYLPAEALQKTVFTAKGLADATHSITIEVTGRKNPASTATWVLVDAFDVRP